MIVPIQSQTPTVMPYKRNYKRRTYKKRPYRKPRTAQSLGSTALSMLKGYALAKLKSRLGLNTEKHWLDTIETNTATSSTMGTMSYPLTIPIGDTVNTRTGSTCRLVSYNCRIRVQANTAATAPTFVRVMFVSFKDTRGTSYGASTFLDNNQRITSLYNMGDAVSSVGYKVLLDQTFPIGNSDADNAQKLINFVYKPLNHHLKWDSADTTGVAADLLTGFVRGYIMTSETGANTPNYWADHRVKWVDN